MWQRHEEAAGNVWPSVGVKTPGSGIQMGCHSCACVTFWRVLLWHWGPHVLTSLLVPGIFLGIPVCNWMTGSRGTSAFQPLPLSRSFFPPGPMSWRFWSKGEQGKGGRILRSFCANSSKFKLTTEGRGEWAPAHRAASSLWSLLRALFVPRPQASVVARSTWAHRVKTNGYTWLWLQMA